MRRQRIPGVVSKAARLAAVVSGLGIVWFLTAGLGTAGLAGAEQPASSALVVMLVIATAAAACAGVASTGRLLLALADALARASAQAPPSERADLPATITQTRPDAAGKPLPRAPGRLLAAA